MAQIPQTTTGAQSKHPGQLIQVSGAIQNPSLGPMVIAQPATQGTPVVAVNPKGKGRGVKNEVILSIDPINRVF